MCDSVKLPAGRGAARPAAPRAPPGPGQTGRSGPQTRGPPGAPPSPPPRARSCRRPPPAVWEPRRVQAAVQGAREQARPQTVPAGARELLLHAPIPRSAARRKPSPNPSRQYTASRRCRRQLTARWSDLEAATPAATWRRAASACAGQPARSADGEWLCMACACLLITQVAPCLHCSGPAAAPAIQAPSATPRPCRHSHSTEPTHLLPPVGRAPEHGPAPALRRRDGEHRVQAAQQRAVQQHLACGVEGAHREVRRGCTERGRVGRRQQRLARVPCQPPSRPAAQPAGPLPRLPGHQRSAAHRCAGRRACG